MAKSISFSSLFISLYEQKLKQNYVNQSWNETRLEICDNLHSLDVKHGCSKSIRFGCINIDQSWNRPTKYLQRLRPCKSFPCTYFYIVWNAWFGGWNHKLNKRLYWFSKFEFYIPCDAFEFKFDIKNYSMDLQGLDERYHSVRFRSFPFYHQKSIIDDLRDCESLDFEWLQLQPLQIC